jgi:hypothetical protein
MQSDASLVSYFSNPLASYFVTHPAVVILVKITTHESDLADIDMPATTPIVW